MKKLSVDKILIVLSIALSFFINPVYAASWELVKNCQNCVLLMDGIVL